MRFFLPNSIIFFLSSLITFLSLYYKIPVKSLQQVVIFIVIILLVFFNKFLLSSYESKLGKAIRITFILLTSMMVQTLVLSSGGLKSPFFILIHLYTLGAGFLIGTSSSIAFLLFSILALGGQIIFDENIRQIFNEDLGTVFLYGASLLVIIPLSVFLNRAYFLKEKLLEVVRKELKLKQIQHDTILKGIRDIIFIIDQNLIITSTNEAAETELSQPESAIVNHPLFNVLFIRSIDGKLATKETLSIDRVIEEKTTRILKGFQLLVRNKARPRFVDIQVRPITNLEGEVEQIMIMLSDNSSNIKGGSGSHPTLEEAKIKYNALVENLKKLLILKNAPELKARADLIWKAGQDISLLAEIEDHKVNLNPILVDTAYFCLKTVSKEEDFAKSLGVNISFVLPNFNAQEIMPLLPKGFQISPDQLTGPYFTCPVDIKWFQLLLHKLLDLVILLASHQLFLGVIREGSTEIKIEFFIPNLKLSDQEKGLLFSQYYGNLVNSKNLRLGSGLEGFLAKTIANILNIPLYTNDKNGGLIIGIKLSKRPK